MMLDFQAAEAAVVPHFKGGEGQAVVRKAVEDEMGRVLTLELPAGSSIGLHTHTGNCEASTCWLGGAYAMTTARRWRWRWE